MRSAFRSMERTEWRLFAVCVVVSLAIHAVLAWVVLPSGSREKAEVGGVAERFAQAVNAATDLDLRTRARVRDALDKLPATAWKLGEMADTIQWQASEMGLPVRDCDVVRALDTERSREGRWDIRVWLDWDPDRTVADLLMLAFLVGEGTLKSDFGSHRLWVHLQAGDGTGRVAFQTMDCRLYRAGKLPASDLLHRAAWFDR